MSSRERRTQVDEAGLADNLAHGATHEDATLRSMEKAAIPPELLVEQTGVVCRSCFTVFERPPGAYCPQCDGDYRDGDWQTMPFEVGGRYECFRLVGRGGMGAVFLAHDMTQAHLRRRPPPVAVKVVQTLGGEGSRDTLRNMFRHEAAVATLLGRTELFVKVLAHESSGRPYLVMEYVNWPTLSDVFARSAGPLEPKTVARIGSAVLEAVEVMHFYRVVHRDLKPANIFAKRHPGQERFKVKIADLGIWTEDQDVQGNDAAEPGGFLGSLRYASPEQMAGTCVGARSDLFSIGCLLWEAATGGPPFAADGKTLEQKLAARKRAIERGEPRPSDMPIELYDALMDALRPLPGDRYPSARAMSDALRHATGLLSRRPARRDDGSRHEGPFVRGDTPVGSSGTTLRGKMESAYELGHMLGAGGTSRVYEAYQRALDRRVAIKCLNHNPPKGFSEPDWFMLFRLEAQAASRLDHPNHVHVLDFGYNSEDLPFVAREILDGESLEQRLKRESSLSEVEALAILTRVAGTLVEAHEKNIVHRNLKPASVWLVPVSGAGEVVKVANYGLALDDIHLLPDHFVFGTPRYMAPEQLRGEPPSTSSDLYALGLLLYLCMADTPAYAYTSTRQLLRAKLHEAPRPLPERNRRGPISRGTRAVVDALLIHDPAQRPSDTAAVYGWLDALLAGFEEDVPIKQLESRVRSTTQGASSD